MKKVKVSIKQRVTINCFSRAFVFLLPLSAHLYVATTGIPHSTLECISKTNRSKVLTKSKSTNSLTHSTDLNLNQFYYFLLRVCLSLSLYSTSLHSACSTFFLNHMNNWTVKHEKMTQVCSISDQILFFLLTVVCWWKSHWILFARSRRVSRVDL